MRRRDMGILFLALAAAGILTAALLFQPTLETGSWGLSFRQPGEAPVGNADGAQLREYNAFYMGDGREKVLYLTFDAGYENGHTSRILDTLKARQVPAAFFLVGHYIETNGDLVRRMVSEGHTVANHTMHHPDMRTMEDREAFARELQQLEEVYRSCTGAELSKFYRPPQGLYSQQNLELARDLGYRTVFWSLAYVDWNNDAQPSRENALSTLLGRTHPGAVVLLHSTSRTNGEILDELITRWQEMGYRFGTLEELFAT